MISASSSYLAFIQLHCLKLIRYFKRPTLQFSLDKSNQEQKVDYYNRDYDEDYLREQNWINVAKFNYLMIQCILRTILEMST